MTKRQKQVLDFICEFSLTKGYSPSYTEIGAAMGLASLSTVSKHVKALSGAMIQRRDDLKRLMGDGYTKASRDARAVLRGVAGEAGIDIAAAALQIAKQMDADGHDPSIVIAALVDESEASV